MTRPGSSPRAAVWFTSPAQSWTWGASGPSWAGHQQQPLQGVSQIMQFKLRPISFTYHLGMVYTTHSSYDCWEWFIIGFIIGFTTLLYNTVYTLNYHGHIPTSRTSCHHNMAVEFSHTSKKRIFRYPSSIRIIHKHQVLPFLPDLGDGVPMVQWWPPILVGEKDDKRWPMNWMGYPILDKPMFEGCHDFDPKIQRVR